MAVSTWLGVTLMVTLLGLCGARPRRTLWPEDAYRHDVTREEKSAGTSSVKYPKYFYPDQEYFERDAFIIDSNTEDSKSSDQDSAKYDDQYSGWFDSDDEDLAGQNFIPVLPRDKGNYNKPSKHFGRGFEQKPIKFDPMSQYPYGGMEEEYFGNEIHDIDKIEELTKRMIDMQTQLEEMQNMLMQQQYYRRGRK